MVIGRWGRFVKETMDENVAAMLVVKTVVVVAAVCVVVLGFGYGDMWNQEHGKMSIKPLIPPSVGFVAQLRLVFSCRCLAMAWLLTWYISSCNRLALT